MNKEEEYKKQMDSCGKIEPEFRVTKVTEVQRILNEGDGLTAKERMVIKKLEELANKHGPNINFEGFYNT